MRSPKIYWTACFCLAETIAREQDSSSSLVSKHGRTGRGDCCAQDMHSRGILAIWPNALPFAWQRKRKKAKFLMPYTQVTRRDGGVVTRRESRWVTHDGRDGVQRRHCASATQRRSTIARVDKSFRLGLPFPGGGDCGENLMGEPPSTTGTHTIPCCCSFSGSAKSSA